MRKHPLCIAAVALSAFLIFLIQPLAARSLLPSFGGSGSVWVTSLVFYQIALAAGYLLAHLARARLTRRGQALALVLMSTAALSTLSVQPKPIDAGSDLPAVRLLLSLAVSVGPPFLVLAVAGPLVQSWVAAQGVDASAGRNTYALYAIANAASLAALVGYPIVMEPRWGVLQQIRIWDGLFGVVVLLLIVISWPIMISRWAVAGHEGPGHTDTRSERCVERPRTLLWLSWSAAGVMVLTSTSSMIGQEIVAIPMLWVIPLSLYLLTWIVTFSGAVRPGPVAGGVLALLALVLIVLGVDNRLYQGFVIKLGLALAGMTLACLTIHASLYRLRPGKRQLTRFYAAMACGGAAGGILTGVVAIQVCQDWRDLGLAYSLVAFLACIGLIPGLRTSGAVRLRRAPSFLLIGLLVTCACQLIAITGMERPGLLYKHRDFHGLVRVVEEGIGHPGRHQLVLYHGTTVHGSQFLNPDLREAPTTYYGRGTGAEIAVQARRVLSGSKRGVNIGVVGLGVGTMAAHLRAQDTMCFYELSPVVADLAMGNGSLRNSGHGFSYLDDARGEVEIVIGDARLSLTSELAGKPEGNSYDLLVLDAFSGDAIPVHLLTREAFSLFARHLAERGMIAVHVSSSWLDLVPVVYAWADAARWRALTISTRADAGGAGGYHTVWVLLFQDPATLRVLAGICQPLMAEGKIMVQNLRNVSYGNLHPWTDKRSDLMALIRSQIRLRKQPATSGMSPALGLDSAPQ
jgi:hypothetical protein